MLNLMKGFNERTHNITSDEQITSHPSDAPFTTCKLINVVVSISRNNECGSNRASRGK